MDAPAFYVPEPDGTRHVLLSITQTDNALKTKLFRTAVAACVFAGVPGFAAAATAGTALGGTAEVLFIAQIVVLILVGRLLGEVMQRIGQPAVVGQLLAGLILGPSLFGWIWPEGQAFLFPHTIEQKSMISAVSQLGILMLLLLTGMETDLALARKVGGKSFLITALGVAVPFACGFALGEFLPRSMLPDPSHRVVAALFLGTALSISSIKIVAMVIREMNFMRRNLGQIIVAAAIMEDSLGWIIIAVTLGIATAGGIALVSLARTVIGVALFLGFSFTVGRTLVFKLIRWVNDTFQSEYAVVSAILIVMGTMAVLTDLIGVHTVLGAFVAGVLVGESPILTEHIQQQVRGLIVALFMPVFFGLSGLSADLTILKDPTLALYTLGLVAIASVGKFTGAFLGAELAGLNRREAFAIGCGMNARGATEVIVATIGLSMGVLTQNLFTMIVTMAVITTSAMPPMLRWALLRLPPEKEERERLEKEELDEKGFVSRFERLLAAVDDGLNGKFATHIAGFVAGQRGMPLTLLEISKKEGRNFGQIDFERVVKTAARQSSEVAETEKGDDKPRKVDITKRAADEPEEAVSDEARKGYDFLFVGIDRMRDGKGAFTTDLSRAVSGFDGPMGLVMAGDYEDAAEQPGYNILVPVNGTEASRRGLEMALSIASAEETQITALLVGERKTERRGRAKRTTAARKAEKAILEDVKALAKRHGHAIRPAIRLEGSPEEAIFEEAKKMKASLIVIGASRRVGDLLYYGKTVGALLEKWKGAVIVVGS
jgi:Kef-type K+ transport system membrane component KefB/nucleotide-binding universal stress UspA family protein